MLVGSSHEIATRSCDGRTSSALFRRIEATLREARLSDDTLGETLTRVRSMFHSEFKDVTIVRSFVIDDELSFSEWHVVVRYPDGREVKLTHE